MSTSVSNPKESAEQTIRLRRLPSRSSSNYTTETDCPPAYNASPSHLENPFLSPDDASSIFTGPSRSPSNPIYFQPTHVFRIDCLGKPRFALPTPTNELKIPVYAIPANGSSPSTYLTPTSNTNPNLNSNPTYTSVRPTKNSGSCTLISGSPSSSPSPSPSATQTLSQTTYTFGMRTPPQLTLYTPTTSETITLKSSSLFSRATVFTSTTHGKFTWRYAPAKERVHPSVSERWPQVNTLLLMERVVGKGKEVVARLVRGEGTRTEGSSATCAGNGGLLEVLVRYDAEGDGDELLVLVVSTCLIMLKKEVDRMRAVQVAAIGAVVT